MNYQRLLLIFSLHDVVISINRRRTSGKSVSFLKMTSESPPLDTLKEFCKTLKRESSLGLFDPSEITTIRHHLLSWYYQNRRKLPWRGDICPNGSFPDPPPISGYGIWVSEVMLQQTRVETVISYWSKWMSKFPTIDALANATPDEVNALWAGLGYYRRGQQLLKGAQKIVHEMNGELPQQRSELLDIPGIGPYTAGAISSIAFRKVEPVVDGNVIRVLSRLKILPFELGGGNKLEKECWKLAEQLVDTDNPGDFNQAIMELGATVCKPTNPLCNECPVQDICLAKQLQAFSMDANTVSSQSIPMSSVSVTDYPKKVKKKRARDISFSVAVISTNSFNSGSLSGNLDNIETKYLMIRRPPTGLLAGQWEFPNVELQDDVIHSTSNESLTDEGESSKYSDESLLRPLLSYFKETLSLLWLPSDIIDGDNHNEEVEVVEEDSSIYSNTTTGNMDKRPLSNGKPPKKVLFKLVPSSPTLLSNTTSLNQNRHTASSIQILDPILHIFSHQRHTLHIVKQHVSAIHIETMISKDIQNNKDNPVVVANDIAWKSKCGKALDVSI